MIAKKLETYLTKNKLKFEVIKHKTVFTAYDLSQTLKEKLDRIGKTLLVKADGKLYLVVMPAHRRLDITKLAKFLSAKKLSIAKEADMVKQLKVKPGALMPFGAMHKVEVVADKTLSKTRDVLLGAGSFTESLRMKVSDYLKLEQAKSGNFTTSAKLPKQQPPPKKKKKGAHKT